MMPEIEEEGNVRNLRDFEGRLVLCIKAATHMSIKTGGVYRCTGVDERMFSRHGGGLCISNLQGQSYGFYKADRFGIIADVGDARHWEEVGDA